jgi:uncharacterized membrane protein YsdA (DUF1294 family)
MDVIVYIIVFLVFMNIIGFASMGIDKYKAVHREWRIPERTLFVIAIFGGSLGSTIGMYAFHHKTKHWYFSYGLPAILLIQILLAAFLIGSGNIKIM